MSTPGSNTFGNYMLHDLLDTGITFHEIQLPLAIDWWPSTPGWTVLAILAGLWLARRLYRAARHWWQNRYRKEALQHLQQIRELDSHQGAAALSGLLRAVALNVYTRRDVAALSGSAWLTFLENSSEACGFDSELGQRWLQSQYLPPARSAFDKPGFDQLLALAEQWIITHSAQHGRA